MLPILIKRYQEAERHSLNFAAEKDKLIAEHERHKLEVCMHVCMYICFCD